MEIDQLLYQTSLPFDTIKLNKNCQYSYKSREEYSVPDGRILYYELNTLTNRILSLTLFYTFYEVKSVSEEGNILYGVESHAIPITFDLETYKRLTLQDILQEKSAHTITKVILDLTKNDLEKGYYAYSGKKDIESLSLYFRQQPIAVNEHEIIFYWKYKNQKGREISKTIEISIKKYKDLFIPEIQNIRKIW